MGEFERRGEGNIEIVIGTSEGSGDEEGSAGVRYEEKLYGGLFHE